jgi:phage terminase large subunit-like protein
MRLQAQTALIENGFVHIPETAPWPPNTSTRWVFPKGKHDDQVDSTAQFLDRFKKPMPNWEIFEYARKRSSSNPNRNP